MNEHEITVEYEDELIYDSENMSIEEGDDLSFSSDDIVYIDGRVDNITIKKNTSGDIEAHGLTDGKDYLSFGELKNKLDNVKVEEQDPTVPEHVKQISEDEISQWNANTASIQALQDDKADKSSIPSKTSDLTNDSGFITAKDVPVPVTKLSELTNDTGFITNTVDNLVNYYAKNDTYSKQEVNTIVNNISKFSAVVVETLPDSGISTTSIYLILKTDPSGNDYYDEYIYLVGHGWEFIGTTKISLDNYYDKPQIDTLISDFVTVSEMESYVTTVVESAIGNVSSILGNTEDLEV